MNFNAERSKMESSRENALASEPTTGRSTPASLAEPLSSLNSPRVSSPIVNVTYPAIAPVEISPSTSVKTAPVSKSISVKRSSFTVTMPAKRQPSEAADKTASSQSLSAATMPTKPRPPEVTEKITVSQPLASVQKSASQSSLTSGYLLKFPKTPVILVASDDEEDGQF
jgi:hypothetical protein